MKHVMGLMDGPISYYETTKIKNKTETKISAETIQNMYLGSNRAVNKASAIIRDGILWNQTK